jgi:hypothetical protein
MEYLYLIQCHSLTKIGIAKNVEDRLLMLQTGNPYSLAILRKFEVADASRLERVLHCRFADARVRGEWFALTTADIEALAEIVRNPAAWIEPVGIGKSSRRLPDLSILPTERVLAEKSIKILPTLRVERRGDRFPIGWAFYQRGKPVYVGYISEAML